MWRHPWCSRCSGFNPTGPVAAKIKKREKISVCCLKAPSLGLQPPSGYNSYRKLGQNGRKAFSSRPGWKHFLLEPRPEEGRERS